MTKNRKILRARAVSRNDVSNVPSGNESKQAGKSDRRVLATIKLAEPKTYGRTTYTELVLLEPIAGDLWGFPDDNIKFGHYLEMGARLANVEPFVIRNLSGHEAMQIVSAIQYFLLYGRSPKDQTPLPSSATQGTALDSTLGMSPV